MKSKIKYIIIVAVIAAILGGALVALNLTAPAEEETEPAVTEAATESVLLYDKNPRDIQTLTIENEAGSYKVERVGSGEEAMWTVFELVTVPLNEATVNTLLESAASLTAQKVVAENAADMSIYGLDNPQAIITVEFTDSAKTVKKIRIGADSPKSGQIYMCFDGESKVYTVFTSAVKSFLEDKYSCVKKTVYTAYTPADATDTTDYTRINKMTVSRKDIDYDIVIEYDKRLDNPDIIVSNSSSYVLTSPVHLDLNPDECKDVTGMVFGLSAADFAVLNPTEEEKAQYGLNDPTADITMNIVGGDFHMTVGNPYTDEDGKQTGYYAYVEGIDIIYIFNNESLPWVSFMPLDITTTMITSNYIYGITSLDVSGSGVNAAFTMTGSTDADFAVKLNGADIDKAAFKTLYQFMLKTPAEELCFDEPSGDPDLTITIKSASGTDVIEYFSSDNRRTLIRLNGVPSFTCKTAYLERLIDNMGKFENGEDIILTW